MGDYRYSKAKRGTTPEELDELLPAISKEIWGEKYNIVRSPGIPLALGQGLEDHRAARWEFWLPDWEADCAFTISLVKGGKRMEFKVPRSQYDQWYEDQQEIRSKLVHRLA